MKALESVCGDKPGLPLVSCLTLYKSLKLILVGVKIYVG